MHPDVQYTPSEPQIAFQVLGDEDLDLVFAFDWASNLDLIWQHPSVERFLRRLAVAALRRHRRLGRLPAQTGIGADGVASGTLIVWSGPLRPR